MSRTVCTAVMLSFAGFLAAASSARAVEHKGGSCHALLVGGFPGSPVYARRYGDWLRRFHSYLTKTGDVPERNIVLISDVAMSEDDGFPEGRGNPEVKGKASPESIAAAFEEIAGRVRVHDQFILILVGHGAITADPPTLVVRGPDPDASLFARGLEAIRAKNQVVLNFTSSAGAFIRHLKADGRVNVAANSATEGVEPVYAEFFLRGLESKRADGMGAPEAGRKDGVTTLLEAYNWATYETALWISRLSYVEGGFWRIDGRESVEIFEKLCGGPPGVIGARKLAPGGRRDAPDEIVRIRPPGEIPMEWATRRAISEHASLEDCGEEIGISALVAVEVPAVVKPDEVERAWDVEPVEPREPEEWSGRDFKPLAGRKKGEPGHLARRVVLGRAELFTER